MAATPNPESERVAAIRARRDNSDGWERGYNSPFPQAMEQTILANIAKVSPTFVAGYNEGVLKRLREEADLEWREEQLTIEDAMRFRSGRRG